MTNWTKKYTHRTSGLEIEVLRIDDYFGVGEAGYKLPNGRVMLEDGFKQFYEVSEQ